MFLFMDFLLSADTHDRSPIAYVLSSGLDPEEPDVGQMGPSSSGNRIGKSAGSVPSDFSQA
jgi:hypothetical protein